MKISSYGREGYRNMRWLIGMDAACGKWHAGASRKDEGYLSYRKTGTRHMSH